MNNTFRWIIFLVIGVVFGFMGSLLFNDDKEVANTNQQPQVVEEATAPVETTNSETTTKETDSSTGNEENIFVQKGCSVCHDVSPLGIKGNGTGPDLAIAYEDVNNRFGKNLEEFLDEPEGTMSAILSASPLTEEEKAEIISLIKEYGEK